MRSGMKYGRARKGFTLVELLAVIAIIGILAAIVVPNVARYIARSRVAKAVSEINNAELALTGALSDTGRSSFREFLTQTQRQNLDCWSHSINQTDPFPTDDCTQIDGLDAVLAARDFYDEFFYELLRQGKNSVTLQDVVVPEVRQKLGSSYMDIGNDPWGKRYHFWMGPLRGPVPFRAYRVLDGVEVDDPGISAADCDPDPNLCDLYIFTPERRQQEQNEMPGQPAADEGAFGNTGGPYGSFGTYPHAYGYPGSRDLAVYIWSEGPNSVNDGHLLIQLGVAEVDTGAPIFLGGGDDPNNWDNESGWENAPK